MSKIEGYCIQNGEPTPDNPVEIETLELKKDIKILEKDYFYFNEIRENLDHKTIKFYEALKRVLSEYTRQKQINEEHQKENGLLREKVKELERENRKLKILSPQSETYKSVVDNREKINELVRAVNKLNKEREEK